MILAFGDNKNRNIVVILNWIINHLTTDYLFYITVNSVQHIYFLVSSFDEFEVKYRNILQFEIKCQQ